MRKDKASTCYADNVMKRIMKATNGKAAKAVGMAASTEEGKDEMVVLSAASSGWWVLFKGGMAVM